MEKFVVITYLFDFYQELLTEKQRDMLKGYYFEDLSLGELASSYGISRQSAFDTIKKAEQKMLDFEDKLGLWRKYQENEHKLELIKEKCKTINKSLAGDNIQEMSVVLSTLDELISKM